MKHLLILSLAICSSIGVFAQASIPQVVIKDLEERPFNTKEITNDGKPIIINFWATWCAPCKRELSNISDVYEDWQDETGVKLIAVSIDDVRNMAKVGPYVNGADWDYEVLLDINGDFKRALNVNTIPHTFLVDGNRKIVWQHTTYNEGDEEELYELVKKLSEGESID